MVSSTSELITQPVKREEVVPSGKRIKLPAWLEVVKPRLIPLLLATTVGGMALSEEWPLPSPRLACTLGGGALAAAAAGALNCLWEQDLDKRMKRTSNRALPSGRLSQSSVFFVVVLAVVEAEFIVADDGADEGLVEVAVWSDENRFTATFWFEERFWLEVRIVPPAKLE